MGCDILYGFGLELPIFGKFSGFLLVVLGLVNPFLGFKTLCWVFGPLSGC